MVSRLEYSISKTWDTHRELSRKNFSYPYDFIKLYFSHGSQTVRTFTFQDSVVHPRGLGVGGGGEGGGRWGTLGISWWGCAAGKNVKILSSTCTFLCHDTSYTTNTHHFFFLRAGRLCMLMSPNKGETALHG